MLVLILDLLPPRRTKEHLGGVALAGIVAALLAAIAQWGRGARAFRDMVLLDDYALFLHVVICYAAALAVLLSIDYLRRNGIQRHPGDLFFRPGAGMELADRHAVIGRAGEQAIVAGNEMVDLATQGALHLPHLEAGAPP